MDEGRRSIEKALSIGMAALLVSVAGYALVGPGLAQASHEPADRTAATGSTLEIMESATDDGSFSEVHTILSTELKTSSPTDLLLSFTAECALWTDVMTVGNDQSEAVATVNVWIEVDGERVPVSATGSPGDTGQVTLCHRTYRVETMHFDDENATIERFLRTKQANAFNWISLDPGNGVHEIAVKAQLEGHAEAEDGSARAKALIGKRTLIVEPVKLPHDASL